MITSLVRKNISIKPWTTFKVGGIVKYFAEPQSIDEIKALHSWTLLQKLPVFILGKGSNVVVSDRGFPGLIIHLGKSFSQWQISGNKIKAQAGCLLNKVVAEAIKTDLSGIELLAGIPGTVGGGTYINAGAYGQELKQIITSVTSLNSRGQVIKRQNHECNFAYRNSIFTQNHEWILEVEMALTLNSGRDLRKIMQKNLKKRKDQQPIELPNAGSMFKRPKNNFAGALIEKAGLKGLQMGKAQVSHKHANFIVNLGGATAQDIWDLSEKVIAKVKTHSSIVLEREVIFLGEF
ncbi:MAG: UDP-N-acetylmuramate dehydrogenase [Fibrobacter sp.]|nr:UDP-N-acetylmuramate dehydrogenase [Fibrobacter sp.]